MSAITTIEVGATVLISGLKAAPELNGTIGTVVGEAPKPGRWHLKTKSSRDGLTSLKEENLTVLSKGTMHASAEAACAAGCGPKGGMHVSAEAACAAGCGSKDGGAASHSSPSTNNCEEFENRCPICLGNEDDAIVNGSPAGMCSACGQLFCGACNGVVMNHAIVVETDTKIAWNTPSWREDALQYKCKNCPMCRATLYPSFKQQFKRSLKLVNDRSPGRYSPIAFFQIGSFYKQGQGVAQNDIEAVKWWTLAAELGHVFAQNNLGTVALSGIGMIKSVSKAVEWFEMAAEQGHSSSPPTTTEEEDFFELAGPTATATPLRDARLFV